MIVVDTSAIVAIFLGEPEAPLFTSVLASDPTSISAVNLYEAETVLRGRKDKILAARVRALLEASRTLIVPFDDAQAQLASEAYAVFGKGIHPARLNLGDCAAYALAKSLDAPLLYKGDDFARTDIVSAVTTG